MAALVSGAWAGGRRSLLKLASARGCAKLRDRGVSDIPATASRSRPCAPAASARRTARTKMSGALSAAPMPPSVSPAVLTQRRFLCAADESVATPLLRSRTATTRTLSLASAMTVCVEATDARPPAAPVPRFDNEASPSAARPPSAEDVQHMRELLRHLDPSRSTWLSEDVEGVQRQPARRRKRKPAGCRAAAEPDDAREQDLAAQCLLLMLQSDASAPKKRHAKRSTHKPVRRQRGGLSAAEALQATRKRRSRKGASGEARSGSISKRAWPVYAR